MAGRTSEWGEIANRGHTCCAPARQPPHTAIMDAPGNRHKQSYENTHFLSGATRKQTRVVLCATQEVTTDLEIAPTFFLPTHAFPAILAASGGAPGD